MTSYVERHAAAAAEALGPDAHASITFLHAGATLWVASNSDRARACDVVETRLDEGPCIDAMRTLHTVLVPDISEDGVDWPAWRLRALAEGFRWCAATPAALGGGAAVALNLYSDGPLGPSVIGLAADRVGALAAEMRKRLARDDSELALVDSSDAAVVEQAVGVLMHAKDCDPVEARELLEEIAARGGSDVPTAARRLLDLAVAGVDPLEADAV